MALADELWKIKRDEDRVETAIFDKIEAAGIKCQGFDTDAYDGSIEIRDASIPELTIEQLEVLWGLGFIRAWLHGTAGEKFYVAPVVVAANVTSSNQE